jgi:hypothetical protein
MRYIVAITALLATLTVGLGWGLLTARAELSEVKSTVSTQEGQIDALKAAQARTAASLAKLAAKSQSSKAEVTHALAQEPTYRDAPVPPAVADGLCKRLKCKR